MDKLKQMVLDSKKCFIGYDKELKQWVLGTMVEDKYDNTMVTKEEASVLFSCIYSDSMEWNNG